MISFCSQTKETFLPLPLSTSVLASWHFESFCSAVVFMERDQCKKEIDLSFNLCMRIKCSADKGAGHAILITLAWSITAIIVARLTTSAFAVMQKLNERVSLSSQDPILLTFEDDESETSELTVTQVSSFEKSANGKVSEEITFFYHNAGLHFVSISMTCHVFSVCFFKFSLCQVQLLQLAT